MALPAAFAAWEKIEMLRCKEREGTHKGIGMKVADLTVEELQEMLYSTLRQLIEEVVEEKLGMTSDPDAGLALRPEVAASLQEYLESDRRGDDADEVFRSLGLE